MNDEEIEDRRETHRPDPDRRGTARRRCILTGYVFFPNDDHVLSVRVTNLSDVGAKLHLGGLRPLPDRFTLAVPQRLLAYEALIVWKKLPDLGVIFAGRPSPEMLMRIDATVAKLR
jgi:hypothetical protein